MRAAPSPTPPKLDRTAGLLALLGRRDYPTDALEHYCTYLQTGLRQHGEEMGILRLAWDEQGWIPSLRQLRVALGGRPGVWVFLQFTALSWSNRGFPLMVVAPLLVARAAGARTAVVFHDPTPAGGSRVIDRVRGRVQAAVMRLCYHLTERSVLTIPLAQATWLPSHPAKACFVPVGANIVPPDRALREAASPGRAEPQRAKTVAVFGITGGDQRAREVRDIGQVLRYVTTRGIAARLIVLGRGAEESRSLLTAEFERTEIPVHVKGVVPAPEIAATLGAADAMLFVRGHISSRRGSALAAIACGLPVVSYSGAETAPPVTESGVVLVPEGDVEALGRALADVLSDSRLRRRLTQLSLAAQQRWFAWPAIAEQLLDFLQTDPTQLNASK